MKRVYGVTECLPPECYWCGPNWMTAKWWQLGRRTVYVVAAHFGFMVRNRDLEKMGHGFRVYRLVADKGSIQPMCGEHWKR